MATVNEKLAGLATMSPVQLRGEWLQVFHTAAPPVGHTLHGLALAYRLQARAIGGLPVAAVRELDTLVRQVERSGVMKPRAGAGLRSGTRLVREWRGTTHQVLLHDGGYIYNDQQYRSLSEIARRITGTRWSGPRFFGLVGANDAGANRSGT